MTSALGHAKFVVCCGMYRSASTWQYLVASELIETAGLGRRSGLWSEDVLERSKRDTLDGTQTRVIKVHEYDPKLGALIHSGDAKAIYSYRDIRDVACSIMWKLNQPFGAESVRKMLESAIDTYYTWTSHSGILIQRYETLMANPLKAVLDIARHINTPISRMRAKEVVDTYNREANRERSKRFAEALLREGKDLSQPENALRWDPQTLLHWNHVRPGQDSSWRESLGRRELLSLEPLMGRWLIDACYESDETWLARWLSKAPDREIRLESNAWQARKDNDIDKEYGISLAMTTSGTDRELNQFVSSAQNFEDVLLWRALKTVKHGFYIDVGAWSPDLDSVTRAFYQRGWRGINIEPHPSYHSQLVEERPGDINLNVALGDEAGLMDLHLVDDTGLSTLDADIAKRHERSGYAIRAVSCSVLTLNDVWEKHVEEQTVHFMNVDVEGFEGEVLRGNDWTEHRPWILLIESTSPNTQTPTHERWEPFLLGHDYLFAYADGLNRFYVASEHSELLSSFQFPPNYFDDFKTARQLEAETDADARRHDLVQTKHELDSVRETLVQIEARLASLSDQLHQVKQAAKSRAEELTKMKKEAEARAEELANTKAEAETRAEALVKTRKEAEARAGDLAKAKEELEDARQHKDQLQHQVLSMHYSKSWRITSPLRAAALKYRDAKTSLSKGTRRLRVFSKPGRITSATLQTMRAWTEEHATLRNLGLSILNRIPGLKMRLQRLAEPSHDVPLPDQHLAGLEDLTPYGREIYRELRDAIERRWKQGH